MLTCIGQCLDLIHLLFLRLLHSSRFTFSVILTSTCSSRCFLRFFFLTTTIDCLFYRSGCTRCFIFMGNYISLSILLMVFVLKFISNDFSAVSKIRVAAIFLTVIINVTVLFPNWVEFLLCLLHYLLIGRRHIR